MPPRVYLLRHFDEGGKRGLRDRVHAETAALVDYSAFGAGGGLGASSGDYAPGGWPAQTGGGGGCF